MLITNIEGFNLSSPLERPFGWSNGWISARVVGLLKIETDEGITGWGEGYVGARGDFVKQLFGNLLIGADPLNRNALWQGMFDRVYNGNNAVASVAAPSAQLISPFGTSRARQPASPSQTC